MTMLFDVLGDDVIDNLCKIFSVSLKLCEGSMQMGKVPNSNRPGEADCHVSL